MKKYANYYIDGKIKYDRKNGLYYYKDKDGYLFSQGIYKTKIKEEDLPDYYIKVWLCPKYKYISLKNIIDIKYKPSFFTNHWRKDDLLYISYSNIIDLDSEKFTTNYDVIIYGPEIDRFIKELEKYNYHCDKILEIKKLMNKKDKWFKYWEEHNWDGNYSFTSKEIWKEIMGEDV